MPQNFFDFIEYIVTCYNVLQFECKAYVMADSFEQAHTKNIG